MQSKMNTSRLQNINNEPLVTIVISQVNHIRNIWRAKERWARADCRALFYAKSLSREKWWLWRLPWIPWQSQGYLQWNLWPKWQTNHKNQENDLLGTPQTKQEWWSLERTSSDRSKKNFLIKIIILLGFRKVALWWWQFVSSKDLKDYRNALLSEESVLWV